VTFSEALIVDAVKRAIEFVLLALGNPDLQSEDREDLRKAHNALCRIRARFL
jgi:hypothetical protein